MQVQTPYNPFLQVGTLEGYQSMIGQWSKRNSRLIFMLSICASLVIPFLESVGQEFGGFNWVGHSSIGKTTGLIISGTFGVNAHRLEGIYKTGGPHLMVLKG